MCLAPLHQGKLEKRFDGRMEPMWITPVVLEEQMLPVYTWLIPGAQLGTVMEGRCARSQAARPGAVLRGTALVQPGIPPARGSLASILPSPVLSLFPIWPVLPWMGGTRSAVDMCLPHIFSSLDALCSLPRPEQAFGTLQRRAALVLGDALPGCTLPVQVFICVCARSPTLDAPLPVRRILTLLCTSDIAAGSRGC